MQHLDHAFLDGGMAKQVLHDINLTVHAGEILAFVNSDAVPGQTAAQVLVHGQTGLSSSRHM